jgi:uncharacterized integral membrane protein
VNTNKKLIAGLVLIGLIVIFVVQNTTVVDIRFLFWGFSLSRALMVLIVMLIGIATGWLLHSYAQHRRKRR